MLTRAIPEAVWRRYVCLVVHPGPPGDRGPSALDWAILEGQSRWGVTVLQAEADLDAGPIWAWHEFPLREVSKSSTYNHEVTDGAVRAVREAVTRFAGGERTPPPPGPAGGAGAGAGAAAAPVRQGDRRIDWAGPTDRVLRALWSADGSPGCGRVGGLRVSLYGGYPEDALRGPRAPSWRRATGRSASPRGTGPCGCRP